VKVWVGAPDKARSGESRGLDKARSVESEDMSQIGERRQWDGQN
jgi:hypothetical protein